MRMSIEECINQVECCRDHQYRDFDKDRIALNAAIDSMRKYQKIKQIIHDDWIKGVNSGATVNKIEEVIEDGQNTIKD